jgi:Concanavalin A-like lectin/glucanases superfamily
VVLIARLAALAAALAGCGQSLFDAHGDGDGSGDGGAGDGGDQLGICDAPCLADAAADFDGTSDGRSGRWRYLEDLGTRSWAAMVANEQSQEMTGASSTDNRITSCAARPGAAACRALPRALLVSSSGRADPAGPGAPSDPAIELILGSDDSNKVIELRLRLVVPSGPDQRVRLYRNSREDSLITAVVSTGAPYDQAIELDALAGDRFYVSIEPAAGSGPPVADLGLHLTATAVAKTFPATCQLALPFEAVTDNSLTDVCGDRVFTQLDAGNAQVPIALGPGPFAERGMAASLTDGTHFNDTRLRPLDHRREVTIQFWVQVRELAPTFPAVPFSDLNIDTGGGIGITIQPGFPMAQLQVATCDAEITCSQALAPYFEPTAWRFVRVVHGMTGVDVCLDGVRVARVAARSTEPPLFDPPDLGKQVLASANEAHLDGLIDEVRVITGALPCAD